MGMLEIRRSSARLNNLGSFRMPELDNGSARAFAAQAEAAKSAAAAARVAGHAAMEGIMRRGQIVARTLGDLGRMAVELANRENERIATNAVLQSENDRNLYMTGDGTPENPGQLNIRQGKDGEWHAEEWLNDIKRAAEARREKFTKDLNGPQRRMYDEMVAKRDVAWNARIFAHAAKTTLDAEIATATAALAQAKEKAIGDFDVGAARESSIQEMYDAKEREMNVRQVPESLRAAEMKSLTEDFLVNFAKTKFTAWENETFDSADPEAVAKIWNEKGDALEGLKGKVIDSEAVRKHLGGDRLDKARRELLEKEFNTHRAAAIARAYTLQRENERQQIADIELKTHEARAKGDLDTLQAAFDEMGKTADRLKAKEKGSRAHFAALDAAVRLDKAADAEARRLDWEAIVADDGAGKYKPPEGSRMAKFHAALKASYEEQKGRYYAGAFAAEDAARREERKSTEIALRVNMLASAQLAPGEFRARLADAAAKGDISLGQYYSLRDEFEDVWQKEGMPRKAAALVDVLKREFFAGKDYDLSERLGVNPKTGRFEYGRNPDTKKPYEGEDAEYKTTELVPVKNRATLFGSFVADNSGRTRPVTTTNTLTSNEQMQLLNRMMELAKHDGEDTYIDPLTKEILSSPRKIDAVDEFQRLCSMIKTEKRTEAAMSVVDRVCDAMLAVDGGWRRFEDGSVESAARRESAEVAARAAARRARRGSFKPKMPTSAGGAKAGLPEDENMED